jgi:hypothetical protein
MEPRSLVRPRTTNSPLRWGVSPGERRITSESSCSWPLLDVSGRGLASDEMVRPCRAIRGHLGDTVRPRLNASLTSGRNRKRSMAAEIVMLTSVPTSGWPSVSIPKASRRIEPAANPTPEGPCPSLEVPHAIGQDQKDHRDG